MKKIFKLSSLLFFMSIVSFYAAQAQTSQDEFIAKWKNMKAYTIEILDAMPEDKLDYKPTDDVRSFKELVLHIAGGNVMMTSGFLKEGNPGIDYENTDMTKAELKDAVATSFDFVAETLASLTEDELAEKVEVFGGNKITRRQVEGLIDSHGIHHRGNLVVYLRLNGIEPPQFRAW